MIVGGKCLNREFEAIQAGEAHHFTGKRVFKTPPPTIKPQNKLILSK
jgi:hypothetical protein